MIQNWVTLNQKVFIKLKYPGKKGKFFVPMEVIEAIVTLWPGVVEVVLIHLREAMERFTGKVHPLSLTQPLQIAGKPRRVKNEWDGGGASQRQDQRKPPKATKRGQAGGAAGADRGSKVRGGATKEKPPAPTGKKGKAAAPPPDPKAKRRSKLPPI